MSLTSRARNLMDAAKKMKQIDLRLQKAQNLIKEHGLEVKTYLESHPCKVKDADVAVIIPKLPKLG